ncbi:MAG: Rieske 2Fe-2S domain-containing protein, partial [Cyanobacteria bacterium J06633_23]
MTATYTERTPESSTTLTAGGPDPQRFDWSEAWYPVHYVEDLDKTKPTRFTLLGQAVVIWWEPTSQTWSVLADQCPHRLAPLSEGRINEAGQLECPYHGWAFSGAGQCEHIPQQPTDSKAHLSNRACVTSMPTAVRQGLLFVYPGKVANAAQVEIPIIEAVEEEPDGWVMLNTFRDLPYDALTLLENVLDASHIPYTHHKTVGKRENAAPMQMDILASGKQGFQGIWPEGPRKGALGTQHTTFVAPGLMYHDLTSKQFGRTLTVVYATPMQKGKCRLFARFPFKFSSKLPSFFIKLTPRWYSHVGNNRVLEDDQIFLHIQERLLEKQKQQPYAQSCYLPTQADRYVVAFRKWISDFE